MLPENKSYVLTELGLESIVIFHAKAQLHHFESKRMIFLNAAIINVLWLMLLGASKQMSNLTQVYILGAVSALFLIVYLVLGRVRGYKYWVKSSRKTLEDSLYQQELSAQIDQLLKEAQ